MVSPNYSNVSTLSKGTLFNNWGGVVIDITNINHLFGLFFINSETVELSFVYFIGAKQSSINTESYSYLGQDYYY